MFTSIRSAWGALGVMLALIALYLVLNQSEGTARLINSSTSGANKLFRTLQGRG